MTTRLVALSVAAIALTACASWQHVRMDIPSDTTVPSAATVTGPAGTTGATVTCTATDTVLDKDGWRVTFVGHRGYRGTLGDDHGSLVVGDVVLTYDGSDITFRGPLAGGEIARLRAGAHVAIVQSGSAQHH